jgi:hypothetical protein
LDEGRFISFICLWFSQQPQNAYHPGENQPDLYQDIQATLFPHHGSKGWFDDGRFYLLNRQDGAG